MTREDAWAALQQVIDPEVGIDIVELGLIYDLGIHEGAEGAVADVTMTLTTPGCPLHDVLADGVERALLDAGAVRADVEVVFDPPWDPSRIGAAGLSDLGAPGVP